MPKQYVFVGIGESSLSCAIGIKHKSKIHLSHITEYAFNNGEYAHNTLFNPDTIQNHIQTFMHTNRLLKTPLILCISNKEKDLNNTHLLQHALGLSKDNLVIASVIHVEPHIFKTTCTKTPQDPCPYTTLIDNNLLSRFLPQGYTTLFPWLFGMGLSSCIIITTCFFIYNNAQISLTQLHHQTNTLQEEIKNILPIAQTTHTLEKKLTLIQQENQQNHDNNTANTIPTLLRKVAETIPADAYISQLLLNNKTNNSTSIIEANKNNNKNTYQIEGFASTPETINSWLTTLSKTYGDAQFFLVSITHNKKASNSPQRLPYSFIIQANT